MSTPATQFLPGDPRFIDQIVNQIKSQGIFDQWRKECLADVDTKPAYQNLTFRVDSSVASFLSKQKWRPEMVKNQMRENLRKHILELGIIEKGVDRIVEQVVQPKVLPIFHPAVENAIYDFLGIPKPKIEISQKPLNGATNNSPLKKAFRPMPVSVPSREQEDATPPPGEEFGLEAITPSPDSRGGSALNKDLADEVSDVSMEDIRPIQESGLERICSPISPQSNSNMGSEKNGYPDSRPASRVASALSAISSNEDLPSGSPVGPSPVTPGDDNTMPPGEENIHSESESEQSVQEEQDDDSDFSSPEFEKLEINHSANRTATPVEEKIDEEDSKKETDDHAHWRPKNASNNFDRKPDEDPGETGPGTGSSSHTVHQSSTGGQTSSSTESKTNTSNSKSMAPYSDITDDIIDAPEAAEPAPVEIITTHEQQKIEKRADVPKRKDRSRSRERKESHKSDKRDRSSHKDRHKDRHRDRSRDRHRKKERKDSERHSKSSSSKSEKDRDSERHKSSKKDKDRDRHRDRSRDRQHRSKSESDRKSHREKDKKSEKHPRSPPHPMAHLWKRPAEQPRALTDWLAQFPDRVFDEAYDGIDAVTDVSVSPVSSYYPSEAESVIYLSDVEVDSELEDLFKSTGGKVLYSEEISNKKSVEEPVTRKSETEQSADLNYTPISDDVNRSENTDHTGSSKRIRKVNTRYNDSYVGSEFRKVIHMQQQHSPEQPQRVHRPNSGGRTQHVLGDYQQNMIAEPSPEEHEREDGEFGPSEPKRIKTEQPLPSSPESVQSDPSLGQNNLPASPAADARSPNDDEIRKEASSPVNRRRASMKPPQKRYDDADLYKPRPVITPSSRRLRRQEDS